MKYLTKFDYLLNFWQNSVPNQERMLFSPTILGTGPKWLSEYVMQLKSYTDDQVKMFVSFYFDACILYHVDYKI